MKQTRRKQIKKNPHAQALGKLGGERRAQTLTKAQRIAIATKASMAAKAQRNAA